MSVNKFFSVEIVDKFSRMFMLVFAGIILGSVLGVATYSIYNPGITVTLVVLGVYCALFTSYVTWTNSKRDVSKVEISKQGLTFVFEKQGRISTRQEILYSDIAEYKITPGTSKKNLALQVPDKNKYSLRIFGFRTCVTKKDGSKIEFKDSNLDGVLAYSPAYVYRMLDLKRNLPEFPLVLENFDSKMDSEDFQKQFDYYEKNSKNLSLFENKRYVLALLRHTFCIAVISAIIVSIIAYLLYTDLQDINYSLTILYIALGIIILILAPTYLAAFCTPKIGGRINRTIGNKIQSVIKD